MLESKAPVDETRAGTVALVGRPNAGKSTLMNAFLGEKLSIVTSKAQTTWRRVTGIHTSEKAQAIFLDTPGLLDVRDLLQRSMLEEAREAAREADLVLFVIDASRPLRESRGAVERELLEHISAPLLVVLNKSDLADESTLDGLSRWAEDELGGRVFRVSALKGDGIERLREAVEDALPLSPFLHPPDEIASQPVRFFVAEFLRETVFEQFRQEIPYSVFCAVEEFKEEQDPIYIQATVYVERASQKQILIGERGSAIRDLGKAAREKIEHFLGRPVYLELWVKALPGWRRKRIHLTRFGFRVPEEHGQTP